MGIVKNSNEFNLWKEVYTIRNKYANNVTTDEQFKAVMDEIRNGTNPSRKVILDELINMTRL